MEAVVKEATLEDVTTVKAAVVAAEETVAEVSFWIVFIVLDLVVPLPTFHCF